MLAGEDSLPVDPTTDPAPGYDDDQRDKPGGFTADPDVMDTWATSSLSPQIATGWIDDPDLFARTFPMDMRPQAHDIIRTWLFYTVVRSHYEPGTQLQMEITVEHKRLHANGKVVKLPFYDPEWKKK